MIQIDQSFIKSVWISPSEPNNPWMYKSQISKSAEGSRGWNEHPEMPAEYDVPAPRQEL